MNEDEKWESMSEMVHIRENMNQLGNYIYNQDKSQAAYEHQAAFLFRMILITGELYKNTIQLEEQMNLFKTIHNMNDQEFYRYYDIVHRSYQPEPDIANEIVDRTQDTVEKFLSRLRKNMSMEEAIPLRELMKQRAYEIFIRNLNTNAEEFQEIYNKDIFDEFYSELFRSVGVESYRLEESDCSESDCAFCLEPLMDSSRIKLKPCNHCFHAQCPSGHAPLEFFTNYGVCPLCRSEPLELILSD